MSQEYNYQDFTPQFYDFTAQSGLQPGDELPDVTLLNISGGPVKLKSLLGKTLVLETGSATCPLYVGKIKSMNAVAAKHEDVNFAVIYVREAHPGSKISAHPTSEAKMKAAQLLQASEPENRTVLVDTLAGKLHEKLGLLPNMAYVIGADGTVLYRADWNIPDRIDEVLQAVKSGAPISTEPANFTPVSMKDTLRVLYRAGGMKAVLAFFKDLPKLISKHKASAKSQQ
jgi:peroxiredoxin